MRNIGKIDVQRRTNLPQSLNTDWKKLDIQFKGISENQNQFKKNLQTIISNIFTSYKNNGFKNDKNLKLLKSYYLIKNLADKDGRFVDIIQKSREATIGFIDSILQDISKSNFEIDGHSLDLYYKRKVEDTETNKKQIREYSIDIFSILQDIIKEIPSGKSIGEQSIDYVESSDSTQNVESQKENEDYNHKQEKDEIPTPQKDRTEIIKIPEKTQVKKSRKTQNKSLFVKIKQFIMFCISEYEQTNREVSNKVKINQGLSFTGSEEIGRPGNRKKSRKDRRKNLPFSKKDKAGDKLEKSIIKNDKHGRKRQKEIITNINGIKDTADKIGNKNPSLIRKTLGVLNPLNIIKKVFGLFNIVGIVGFVGSTIKSAFNIVKSITKGIWNISKKIITSVFSLVKGIGKKIFSEQFIKFMTTPSGMFIAGYIYGTIKKWMDKHSDSLTNLKNNINGYLDQVKEKISSFFERIGPDLQFLYLRMKKINYGQKIHDIINLLMHLLKSFTVDGLIKGAVQRIGAKAIGHIAFTALKSALWAAAGVSAATGVGALIGLGLATAAVVAEFGMMFWTKWSEKKKSERRTNFYGGIGSSRTISEKDQFLKTAKNDNKWIYFGSKKFLRGNLDLLSLFQGDKRKGKERKLKEGIGAEKLDGAWLKHLFENIKETNLEEFEREGRRIDNLNDFFEQKTNYIMKEKENLERIVEGLNSNPDDAESQQAFRDALFDVQLPVFAGGRWRKNLTGSTENPLGVRMANLLAQNEILRKLYEDPDIIEKYGDRIDELEKEYQKRVQGIFSIQDGSIVWGKIEGIGYGWRETFGGSFVSPKDISSENAQTVLQQSTTLLGRMNSGLTSQYERFQEQKPLGRRTKQFALRAPEDKHYISAQLIIGKTSNIQYSGINTSNVQIFQDILFSKSVSDKLKSKNIDLNNRRVSSWREYIGVYASQELFMKKFLEIIYIPNYLGSNECLVNSDMDILQDINIAETLNSSNLGIFLSGGKDYHRPDKLTKYKLNETIKNFDGVQPCDYYLYSYSTIDDNQVTTKEKARSKCDFTTLQNQYVSEQQAAQEAQINHEKNITYSGTPGMNQYAKSDYDRQTTYQDYNYAKNYADFRNVPNVINPKQAEFQRPHASVYDVRLSKVRSLDLTLLHQQNFRNRHHITGGEYSEDRDPILLFLKYKKPSSGNIKIGQIESIRYNDCIFSRTSVFHWNELHNVINTMFRKKIRINEELTRKVIDKMITAFVDFIYPFLKNYFDNIEKFKFQAEKTLAGNDGSFMSDLSKIEQGFVHKLGDTSHSVAQRLFGTSDSDPYQRNIQLKKANEEKEAELKRLESQKKKEQGKKDKNKDKLEKLKTAMKEREEERKRMGLFGDSNSCVTAISRKRKSRRKLLQDRERMDQGHSYGIAYV